MNAPIPERKPPLPTNGDTFLDQLADTVQGTFTRGLDLISKEWEFRRQQDLVKFQIEAEKQAAQTNVTGYPTGAGSIPSSLQAGFNPISIAIMAVAAVLLLVKWK